MRDIVLTIAPDTTVAEAARLRAELTLGRSELSAAHAFLDAQGVPRYADTDYPLPLAQRIRYLVELG